MKRPGGIVAPVVAWFVRNRVAANLLLFGVSLAGYLTAGGIPQEILPEARSTAISVRVPYPGAGAPLVEESVLARLEEALRGLRGVEETAGVAADGLGELRLELESGADPGSVVDEVRERVGALRSLPADAEEPVVTELEVERQLLRLAVHGPADERSLREAAYRVQDAVAAIPGVGVAELESGREYEIAIEVGEAQLDRFGLTLDGVAAAIRRHSADLPGGSIRTGTREVRLRTAAEARTAADYERIPLLTTPEGGRVLLGEVATVTDGFVEEAREARLDGEPAVFLTVTLAPGARLPDTTRAVLEAVRESPLPEGISVTPWSRAFRLFESRMEVLVRNGLGGLALIFLVLFFTLSTRLAVWTAAGLPVAFFGAFLLMPGLSVTVNMISLFAFILTLGIVVDDAIVVGENIWRGMETGRRPPAEAAVRGVRRVLTPVVFGVLTTMAAFTPLLGLPGYWGDLIGTLPRVVIPVLAFSLLEAAFILPHHLVHGGLRVRPSALLARVRGAFAAALARTLRVLYLPALRSALRNRAAALSLGAVWLAVAFGLLRGGLVATDPVPPFERDLTVVSVELPPGSPVAATREVVSALEAAVGRVRAEIREATGVDIHESLAVLVGQQLSTGPGGPVGGGRARGGAHLGQLNWELRAAGERGGVSTREVAERLRESARPLAGRAEITVMTSLVGEAADFSIRVSGGGPEEIRRAAAALGSRLAARRGVSSVSDDLTGAAPEFVARARPDGAGAGFGAAEFGRQLRQAFHGEEVQRLQRGRDEVRVVVRSPASERRSPDRIGGRRARRPGGGGTPLDEVAAFTREEGPSIIRRRDGRRAATVHANVDPAVAAAGAVLSAFRQEELPALEREFPGLRFEVAGLAGETEETLAALGRQVLLALFLIYVLLALPLSSWSQPFVIMAAVPFGLAGAVFGHAILGVNLTITSLFGMAPLTGIVVNDALVLLHFMNRGVRRGETRVEAALRAGPRRFRAVVLTSLTTCAGLAPLLAERSVQAQFLVPMAASLAFGVAFATVVTLILVPVLFSLLPRRRAASVGG